MKTGSALHLGRFISPSTAGVTPWRHPVLRLWKGLGLKQHPRRTRLGARSNGQSRLVRFSRFQYRRLMEFRSREIRCCKGKLLDRRERCGINGQPSTKTAQKSQSRFFAQRLAARSALPMPDAAQGAQLPKAKRSDGITKCRSRSHGILLWRGIHRGPCGMALWPNHHLS